MKKRKLNITLEVLSEVSITFPGTKDSVDEKLQEKWFREKILVEEDIYFLLFCLIANESLSLTLIIVAFSSISTYGLLCNEKSCEATILEGKG